MKIAVFGLGNEKREDRVRLCPGNVYSSLRVKRLDDRCREWRVT